MQDLFIYFHSPASNGTKEVKMSLIRGYHWRDFDSFKLFLLILSES
jgi:hypothetical protein